MKIMSNDPQPAPKIKPAPLPADRQGSAPPRKITPPGSASPPLKIRGGKRGVMISKGGGGSYDPTVRWEFWRHVLGLLLTSAIAVLMVLVLFQSNDCSGAADHQATIKIGGTGGVSAR